MVTDQDYTTVAFTATPASGYRFLNWGTDASGSANPLNMRINNNKTIAANFIKQYTLKVTCDPISAGTVPSVSGLYDEGKKIAISAIPNFPYYPQTLVGTDTDTNPTTVNMNADKSVTVIFQKTNQGESQRVSGNLAGGDLAVGPPHSPTALTTINLKQYEWVQGSITLGSNPPVSATIQDPNGKIMKNFGSGQANFTFMAEISGPYIITFTNNNMFYSSYDLTYTIYHLP